jgi:hypothetical protein
LFNIAQIKAVKPFKSDYKIFKSKYVIDKEAYDPSNSQYSNSPNHVNMPNNDLFVYTRADVKSKMKTKKTKGYFNKPKEANIAFSPSPKDHQDKKDQPRFSNHNLARLQKGMGMGGFTDSLHLLKPVEVEANKRVNYSEFKMSELTDTSSATIQIPSKLYYFINFQIFMIILMIQIMF